MWNESVVNEGLGRTIDAAIVQGGVGKVTWERKRQTGSGKVLPSTSPEKRQGSDAQFQAGEPLPASARAQAQRAPTAHTLVGMGA